MYSATTFLEWCRKVVREIWFEKSGLRNLVREKCTANMCSGITVEVHLKNCNFEKLQFFTVDPCSLYFLQIKNCNFNIIFM